ncbi:zinc ribbon domain-containing protein [Azorhizobium caulinodans]|nr:zinc ribbon domain-containing protein [Azorhizobium caulinodans]
MSPQTETCPGCGAPVHPDDVACAACGLELVSPAPSRRALPVVVGIAGVLVALAAGAGVWVLLTPKAPSSAASAPQQQAAVAPPPQAAPEPPPAPTPIPQTATPDPAPAAPAAAPTLQTVPPGSQRPPMPSIPSDPGTRRDYAKSTQDAFKENGLDMTVTATGEGATVMTLKFNFPAKTAVDLISGGPFPRQCKARGFKQVVFIDANGTTTWTLDLDTDKLTQK